jgi:hypothetical protein
MVDGFMSIRKGRKDAVLEDWKARRLRSWEVIYGNKNPFKFSSFKALQLYSPLA